MNKIFISLREDIESGMTHKDIRDEILRIMDDSGYNVEGTTVRIRNFVKRKEKDIKSIKENHKKNENKRGNFSTIFIFVFLISIFRT